MLAQRFDAPASGAPTVAGNTVFCGRRPVRLGRFDAENGGDALDSLRARFSALGLMGRTKGLQSTNNPVILPYASNENRKGQAHSGTAPGPRASPRRARSGTRGIPTFPGDCGRRQHDLRCEPRGACRIDAEMRATSDGPGGR